MDRFGHMIVVRHRQADERAPLRGKEIRKLWEEVGPAGSAEDRRVVGERVGREKKALGTESGVGPDQARLLQGVFCRTNDMSRQPWISCGLLRWGWLRGGLLLDSGDVFLSFLPFFLPFPSFSPPFHVTLYLVALSVLFYHFLFDHVADLLGALWPFEAGAKIFSIS